LTNSLHLTVKVKAKAKEENRHLSISDTHTPSAGILYILSEVDRGTVQ
jgi:hypothetical protein